MDEVTRLLIVYGTLLPTGIAVALIALGPKQTIRVRALLAFVFGYVLAHGLGQPEWPPFPPKDVTDWPLYFALFSLPLAFLERDGVARFVRHVVPALASGLLAYAMLEPKLPRMERMEAGAWLAGSGVAILLFWNVARHGARLKPEATLLFEWSLVVTATAAALNFSGSQVLSRLASALGPALATAAFWSWKRGASRLATYLVPTFVLVTSAHLLNGLVYSQLTPLALGLIGLGLLLANLVPRPAADGSAPVRTRRIPWNVAHVLLASLPLALAAVHEFREHFQSGSVQDYLDALERGTLPVEQDDDYGYDDEEDGSGSGIDYSEYYRKDG
ncbi:MAG: hypothetical protein H6834_18525 [Planctomycetes bacterium]|nr:hypothetical protein [Planctomycetota bacterium]